MRKTHPRLGFTLIELLVVITIIVVLLALLTPALDKAIYQAHLAVCGSNLHGIGSSVTAYATEHKRSYPHRRGAAGGGGWQPMQLRNGTFDERPVLKGYFDINEHFSCPLTTKLDLADPNTTSTVYASYNLWYGWRYTTEQKALRRIGDRFSWRGAEFALLAGDRDWHQPGGRSRIQASHPDADGVLMLEAWQDSDRDDTVAAATSQTMTLSTWATAGGTQRGALDTNSVFPDLSVQRYPGVRYDEYTDEDRMRSVPLMANPDSSPWPATYLQVPDR